MATLTIRNLPEKVRDRIRVRAAKRGVSMEAEVRDILTQAAAERDQNLSVADVQRWIAKNRKQPGPDSDSAALIRDRRRETILEVVRVGESPSDVFGENYARILAEAHWTLSDVKRLARTSR
jgi:plasmid stability protein